MYGYMKIQYDTCDTIFQNLRESIVLEIIKSFSSSQSIAFFFPKIKIILEVIISPPMPNANNAITLIQERDKGRRNNPTNWQLKLTIVSPIPKLKIPAKGARGRSLNPEDIHFGRAHPSKREK